MVNQREINKHKAKTEISKFEKYDKEYITKVVKKNVSSSIVKSKCLDTPYDSENIELRSKYEDVIKEAYFSKYLDPLWGIIYSGWLDKLEAGIISSENGEEKKVIYTESSIDLYGTSGSINKLTSVRIPVLIDESDLPDKRRFRKNRATRFENFWNCLAEVDDSVRELPNNITEQTWELDEDYNPIKE